MRGPLNIKVIDGKIRSIRKPQSAVEYGTIIVDLEGHFVLPGFIDCHAHIGNSDQIPDTQYAYDLWLAHGVTTIRELGSLGHELDFTLDQARLARSGDLNAPDIHAYARFPSATADFEEEADVVNWLEEMQSSGVRGIKFFGDGPVHLHKLALTQARELGLRTAFHHSPSSTSEMNALATSSWGLTSIEHGYGLPESMFPAGRLQSYSPGHNDSDERSRFIEAGRAWAQAANPGSDTWKSAVDTLVESNVTMVPTFSVYIGARDAHRALDQRRNTFACRELMAFWDPSNGQHGSFLHEWGTREEYIWRIAIEKWMAFVFDFAMRGGRIAVGADSGYAYSLYGFSFIEEMELLVESGLSPEEVVRAATRGGAELLGIDDQTGTVEVGKHADLIITRSDPLLNFKSLYGSGPSVYECDGDLAQHSSITFTMKNGVLHQVDGLLERARRVAGTSPHDNL